jgi:hypothetical protein
MSHTLLRAAPRAALALVAGVLAACQSSVDGPSAEPIGVFQLTVNGDATTISARPTVTFIRAFGVSIGNKSYAKRD